MLSVPVKPQPDGDLRLHASSVSFNHKALVIAGPSGSGKSSLALRMMSLGATLISDDITVLSSAPDHVTAHRPATLPALIEVRGFGLLNTPVHAGEGVAAVLDLGTDEADRLPPLRHITLLGRSFPLFHKPATPYIAEAMIHYLTYGRSD
ncbi:HPr kinase/phosphorylase [Pseudooctadecabacter sp.]|uniref:HPr kinase/phosphorylase n=1 Tax=Pseudooctadecabacter sp. TaxID=1966338 RepID=UPI0025DC43B6|nr:serine/threonine protein kinase [Pseudooctadecabacter sp.]